MGLDHETIRHGGDLWVVTNKPDTRQGTEMMRSNVPTKVGWSKALGNLKLESSSSALPWGSDLGSYAEGTLRKDLGPSSQSPTW